MHYLVTGGCGFIGSYLVRELLAQQHQVTVVDDLSMGRKDALPEGVELIVGDILNESLLIEIMGKGIDGCFHLAAIPSVERCLKEWFRTSEVNALGTVSVFEAARKALPSPIPVVYASSAAVYGTDYAEAIRETTPVAPISSYGVDKYVCEQYARIAWRNHGLPSVGLRLFNVYGNGQPKNSPYSGVITAFMNALEQQQPITIYGDGKQTRDFIFAGDVANAFIAAMHIPGKSAELFNVCTGKAHPIVDVAHMMAHLYGVNTTIDFKPARTGDIRHSCGNPDKLLSASSIPAMKSIRDGLATMLRHTT